MMPPLDGQLLTSEAGRFGAIRKFDIHTGIDFYVAEGASVHAIESGVCIDVGAFTGESAGSPWWNETSYITIQGKDIFLYGELIPVVSIGECVVAGQLLGYVKTVLKKDKGLPMSMLHLEKYSFYNGPVEWPLNGERPAGLESPPDFGVINGP